MQNPRINTRKHRFWYSRLQSATKGRQDDACVYLTPTSPLVLFQVASFKFDVRIHQGRVREACHDNGSAIHVHEVKSFRYLASSDGHETSSSVDGVLHLAVVLRDGAVKPIATSRLHKDWLQGRANVTTVIMALSQEHIARLLTSGTKF
jgi:hypothetical protein